jgi:peptidoglycan/LPS O-acetylase OafA/YrhL
MAREVLQAGERRIARVESLRALAAVGVMLGHAWGVAHGYGQSAQDSYLARVIFGGGFGVFLFFALSGYLLYWPFARRDFGGGAPVRLAAYARNRALRILPLYYVAVLVLLVLQEHGGTAEQWWRFLGLAQNFSAATVGTVDGVLWSVIVELHFYLLLPLLALGLARVARGSPGRATAALLALGALSLAGWLALVTFAHAPSPVWRYNLPTTFFFFVPGMGLALLRLHVEHHRPGWLDGVAGRSGAWLAASALVWLAIFADYRLTPVAAIAAFLAVGACVLPLRSSPALRALDWRPLAALGVVSYSLYVWHSRIETNLDSHGAIPHGFAAQLLIAVPVSIGVAFLSYRLVELPFLRLRRRWSADSAPIEPPPAAAAAPAPVAR